MIKLIKPTKKFEIEYYQYIKEIKNNNEQNMLGYSFKESETFSEMLKRCWDREKGINLEKKDVQGTIFWIMDNNTIIGHIDLRKKLNQTYYYKYGHVAYMIRPDKRNKGYAKKALSLAVDKYKKENVLNRIIIFCANDNIASKKVIEANGGKLNSKSHNKSNLNRYSIELKPIRNIQFIQKYDEEIDLKILNNIFKENGYITNEKCTYKIVCYPQVVVDDKTIEDLNVLKENVNKNCTYTENFDFYQGIKKIKSFSRNFNGILQLKKSGKNGNNYQKLISCNGKSLASYSEIEQITLFNQNIYFELLNFLNIYFTKKD